MKIKEDADIQGRWVPYLEQFSWMDDLDERDKEEIRLAWFYAQNPHGTDGHHRLLLIGKLADRLMTIQDVLRSIEIENEMISYEDFRLIVSALEKGKA